MQEVLLAQNFAMKLGTTFSHRHAIWLSLDPIKSLEELLVLKLDLIRLCCYWNEIESTQGEYSFSVIKTLLDLCEEKKQPVVVTIGMKAPRWPEFYIPSFYQNSETPLYDFIKQTILTLKSYSYITHWQVENEPLDPSGPDRMTIPLETLKQEVAIVKQLDSRPIIITLWGNDLLRRKLVRHVISLADIIGIDLYYKQFLTKKLNLSFYSAHHSSPSPLRGEGRGEGELWITELQAEPWEANEEQYRSKNPKSMNSKFLEKNFERAKKLNPQTILFWGSEYWLWKKRQGDPRMLVAVKEIVYSYHCEESARKQSPT